MNRILYGFPYSSCTNRVKLLMSLMKLEYQDQVVNLAAGEHRKEEFLKLNPVGQVPVLVEDTRVIFDSHAILLFLAETYGQGRWWQQDPYERALVTQWLFFDANEIHNGIGMARNFVTFGIPGDAAAAVARGKAALATLENRLKDHEWLELGKMTLADVACCTLVSVCKEAKLDLDGYPGVRRWLARIEGLPGYLSVPAVRRSKESP
jgi:glutathione S-transferase